jgi:hypothetical protein
MQAHMLLSCSPGFGSTPEAAAASAEAGRAGSGDGVQFTS